MVKRPLFWAGVCLTAVLACMVSAGAEHLLLPRGRTDPAPQFEEGIGLTVSGQVAGCDLMPESTRIYLDHIQLISEDNSTDLDRLVKSSYQITFYTDEQRILPGDLLTVAGECRNFEAASNPGQFDALEYYTSKRVLFTLKSPEILGRKEGKFSWKKLLFRLKYRLCESYRKILGEEQAAALSAITLGEKAMLGEEQKSLYQEGGISHILAISGLHISLLGMGLYRLLRRCLTPPVPAAGLSALLLVSYIEMTGWSASSRRACIMFFLWLGAKILGRAFDGLTALAAAAVCLLITNPGLLKEAAFQLSFLSLLSLLLLSSGMAEVLKIRSKAGQALHSALALQAGMLPCTLYFFYQIPPWSMAVNFIVIPLMPLIMLSGLFGGIAGIFFCPAGMLLAAPSHYLLALTGFLCRLEGMLPKSLLICGRPAPIRIVLYYALLGTAALAAAGLCRIRRQTAGCGPGSRAGGQKPPAYPKRLLAARCLWFAVLPLCFCLMRPARPSGLEVVCLDVGQGDGGLLRFPDGNVCLVDGGSSSELGLWDYRISQTLKYYGIGKIGWWFVSHSDQDHISGLREYLEEYEVNLAGENVHGITLEHLVLPITKGEDETLAQLRRTAMEKGIQVHAAQCEDEVRDSKAGWSLECLAPDASALTGDVNQDSLVLLLRYGTFRMLFTGDLEGQGEKQLALSGRDLSADVLKAGHHGSKNASSALFLEQVRPRLSVVSRGIDNRYGHPAPETLARLEQAGSKVLDTALHGAVILETDGTGYRARPVRYGDGLSQ